METDEKGIYEQICEIAAINDIGEYIRKVQADYDLCEKCAREIELFFISEEKADAKIFV